MDPDTKTILLVEDDVLVRQMYARRLLTEGFRILEASDGVEGLAKLLNETVDLILLDVMMPKMNGYEMLQRVRKDPAIKDIAVIVLTNLNDRPEEIEKIKELGVKEYILKSDITLAELTKKVSSYLRPSA